MATKSNSKTTTKDTKVTATKTGNTKTTNVTTKGKTSNKTKQEKPYMPSDIYMGKKGTGTEIGDPALIRGDYQYQAAQAANQNLKDYADLQSNVDRQNRLATGLEDAVAGRGPTIAQLQFERNRDEAIAANNALAASAQGGNRAIAARSALYANAQLGQQSARDAAILRAQEQIQARGELANAIQQGREADLRLAGTQAQLNQDTALANMAATNTAGQANAAMRYALAKQNQDSINAARQKQADLAAGIRQAGIASGAQVRSAGIMGGASMYGADATLAGLLASLGQKSKEADRNAALTKRQQNIDIATGALNAASKVGAGAAGG